MKFYGFEFYSGKNTTSGTPNPLTGSMNVAGNLAVFSSKLKRDNWVSAGRVTADMQGNCRVAVTAKKARGLHLGMSVIAYQEYLEMLTVDEQAI